MFSLLSEPKVLSLTAPQLDLVSGEQKVVLASKASRLLKTVKLMLAREKSYNVSSAEGRKRGRKQSKTAYQHRCVCLFVCNMGLTRKLPAKTKLTCLIENR